MSCTTWTPHAVASEARPWAQAAWRLVEAQHVASTMKLVDDAAEQDLLETLLEQGKPPLPATAAGLDYLLATPFRYDPPRPGSRFRAATDPGVFYGAQHVRTACAELAYWRWRFLMDAVDLARLEPVPHTAFRARIATAAVDLRAPPFDADTAAWADLLDYRATQAFAALAREAGVGAIVYRSVRDPQPAWCVALLTPAGFAARRPEPQRQTWWVAVQRDTVVCRRESEALIFSAAAWVA